MVSRRPVSTKASFTIICTSLLGLSPDLARLPDHFPDHVQQEPAGHCRLTSSSEVSGRSHLGHQFQCVHRFPSFSPLDYVGLDSTILPHGRGLRENGHSTGTQNHATFLRLAWHIRLLPLGHPSAERLFFC